MQLMDSILENSFIRSLSVLFERSPLQMNKLQESDAELIKIPGTDLILAVTTDSIAEEIETGLYSDPYMMGWMTVMVNISDLCAVGAEPLGILINETFSSNTDKDFIEQVQRGISDACKSSNIFVLGGDTNFSSHLQFGACAFGLIKNGRTISRVGCEEGDILFSSGYLGSGNGYAFSKLLSNSNQNNSEFYFKPISRVKEGNIIRHYASCCMDSSDGAIATLDQLMRLNNIGFIVESDLIGYIEPNTFKLSQSAGLSPWLTLAGLHGEFELIFTMPGDNVDAFLQEAKLIGWEPIRLGKVIKEQEVQINLYDKLIPLDTCRIRNLFSEVKCNVKDYLNELIKLDNNLQN